MNAWKMFSENGNGILLKEFFLKLNQEIAGHTEPDSRGAVLILNTRKGYWIYKVFERGEKRKVRKIRVFSDRYTKKITDFSELEGKIIYLVDDTLTKGLSLLETYQMLAEVLDSSLIYPIVFALNDEVKLNERINGTAGLEREFWSKLQFYIEMVPEDINAFCLNETKLLHDEGIPFVIDLPFFKRESVDVENMNFQIKMTEEQFKVLQKGTDEWIFHRNEASFTNIYDTLYTDAAKKFEYERGLKIFQGFIIQLEDEKLLQATDMFVCDYIIEGTYTRDEEGNYLVVFIPFAIMNSLKITELDKLWDELKGTEFEEKPCEREVLLLNEQVAKYRNCVYLLSLMVAFRFRKYIRETFEIELIYDYAIMEDHFPKSFINSIKNLERRQQIEENVIYDRALKAGEVLQAFPIRVQNFEEAECKVCYSEEEALKKVLIKLMKKREEFWNEIRSSGETKFTEGEILTIEQIKDLLNKWFTYQSSSERRYALTRVVVTMLNTSVCSNKLRKSRDGSKMLRGLRYGENSDLLIPFFNAYLYWAVIVFSRKMSLSVLEAKYGYFMKTLREYFSDKGILGALVSEEDFELNQNYYQYLLKDTSRLYNKFRFLRPYLEGRIKKQETISMCEIEDFVSKFCMEGN